MKRAKTAERVSAFEEFEFDVGQQVKHKSNQLLTWVVTVRMLNESGVRWYYIETFIGGQQFSSMVREESLRKTIR